MTNAFTSFLSCAVVACVAASSFDDYCHLMFVSDLGAPAPSMRGVIPSNCSSGEIDWHYPKGDLVLVHQLPPSRQYKLCLDESWATMIGGVTDMTDGRNVPLGLPVNGKSPCAQSSHGQTTLLLRAEDTQYYMTTFKYRVAS